MRTHPAARAVAKIATKVDGILERRGRVIALRHAMTACEPLLETPSDALRLDLRASIFRKFVTLGVSYQENDFESTDYELYEMAPDLPLLRGPPVPPEALQRGEYFCVVGAAQTYGRLVRRPWPNLLSDALDLPVLNLSRAAAGPDLFLAPRLLELIQKARFVILQVMSGRSIGDEEFPGGRRIAGNADFEKANRWDVLEHLWQKDREVAFRKVRRWNDNYVAYYRQLEELIARPTLLLWLSSRTPTEWRPRDLLDTLDWGSFPQLVGRQIYEQIAGLADECVQHMTGGSRVQPVSRVTGKPCPYFGSGKDAAHRDGILSLVTTTTPKWPRRSSRPGARGRGRRSTIRHAAVTVA